jgi:hypothetical protein
VSSGPPPSEAPHGGSEDDESDDAPADVDVDRPIAVTGRWPAPAPPVAGAKRGRGAAAAAAAAAAPPRRPVPVRDAFGNAIGEASGGARVRDWGSDAYFRRLRGEPPESRPASAMSGGGRAASASRASGRASGRGSARAAADDDESS